WELEGPTNIGGRLTDLAIDPDDPDTVYVAAATGGVWKSTDGGATLETAWDDDDAQAIGAIAIGPDDAVWAGTGELNPGGGSITFGGSGVFRSDDDGRTWKRRGLEDSGTTGRIVVHPTDPDTIYVAAGGSLFNPGGERGIYRSTNGGASWRRVLAPETPFTGGADLVMDPSDPDRLYAAMWDHRREPDVRTYGGVGSGLFRTDDGGDTWKRLQNVETFTPGNANGPPDTSGLASDETLGRIGVAVAPSDPNRVYVITTHTFGQDKGFYVSNDAGESFNTAALPGSQGGFGWWFGRIWVDPANKDHLFVAGVNLRQSFDGGLTWGNSGGVHADQHALQWDDDVANLVYLGNDGGLYRSNTNGAAGTWTKATHEPYTQHYQVEVAETDPSRLTGGTQDNGCIRSWPGAPTQWNDYGCGDGEYVPIDWSDARIFYGCSQYGACRRYDERSGTLTSTNIQDGTTSIRFNWHAPLVIDPNDPAVLYFGGNQLHRSTDRGDTWTLISPAEQNYLTGTFEPGRNDPIYFRWGTLT
ncbi:MAG: WD40/YVTN/BNR-like repeat-containing protein, partial [Nocardioides sp.]